MQAVKSFMMNPEDAELLKKNAKDLGLSDSAFIKLCILIGSQELNLRDNYTFKYSYLRWYKPKDLIEELKKTIEKEKTEEKKVEKIEQPKQTPQPQPQKGKIKIQL
jgi:hypothetical protein